MTTKQEMVNYFFERDIKILLKIKNCKNPTIIIGCNPKDEKKIDELIEKSPLPCWINYELQFINKEDINIQSMIYELTGYFISKELLKTDLF